MGFFTLPPALGFGPWLGLVVGTTAAPAASVLPFGCWSAASFVVSSESWSTWLQEILTLLLQYLGGVLGVGVGIVLL